MVTARVEFKKKGIAKYISHLDLNRCMSRALRRAGLPVWYTQGFNPHPYITFALPLSLGFESKREFMDLRLVEDISMEELASRLAARMPEGITVTAAYPPEHKVAQIASAEYLIRLSFPPGQTFDPSAPRALGTVTVIREGKRGPREIDLTDILQKAEYALEGGILVIRAVLPASPSNNVNPGCIAQALEQSLGVKMGFESVTRLEVYTGDGLPFR